MKQECDANTDATGTTLDKLYKKNKMAETLRGI